MTRASQSRRRTVKRVNAKVAKQIQPDGTATFTIHDERSLDAMGLAVGVEMVIVEEMETKTAPLITTKAARDEAIRLYSLLRISRWTTADASVQRLITSEIARRQRDLYLRLEGAAGMLAGDDAPLGGVVQRLALWSPAMSIMLGTDEVQRNIVGERVLGLPAEPSVDRGVSWRDVRRG